MADLIILYFTIIIGFFVWTKIWKRAILEFFIDELFDLRDGLKNQFKANKITKETMIYENLRLLLNRHINYIHELSYLDLKRAEQLFRKRKDIRKYMNNYVNSLFKSENEKLNEISQEVREKADRILTIYICLNLVPHPV